MQWASICVLNIASLLERIKQLSCTLPWSEMREEQRKNQMIAYLLFVVLVESEENVERAH